MAKPYELIGSKACGSAIVEMALAIAGLPCATTDLPYLENGLGRERLLAINPLGQVPTLVLPDDGVLTESAAMILHIGDVAPGSGLVPLPQDPERAAFLNLLVLLVSAAYPTFTFADDPDRWGVPEEAADAYKQAVDGRRLDIFRRIDAQLDPGPFVFGDRLTAVDLYLAVMSQWRPRGWFEGNTPRIVALATAVRRVPAVRKVWTRHF